MAWTTPMTAVANSVWTAAQWNTHVRDNLLETMPGKATTAGRWFCSTGSHAIAERVITNATVATSQTTTSTAYADLTTVGPSVTVTTGTLAMVFINANMACSLSTVPARISVAVSGATTTAASDANSAYVLSSGTAAGNRFGSMALLTVNAGSNTFTMKYKVDSAATGTYQDREIVVIPFS
jgi:hypothetical protein